MFGVLFEENSSQGHIHIASTVILTTERKAVFYYQEDFVQIT